jgi:ketosteroid isomerase-like protein
MLSWLAKRIISRNMARLRAGDYGALLRLDADDVRFRFPGDSSWATDLQGKEQLERWLRRFVDVEHHPVRARHRLPEDAGG